METKSDTEIDLGLTGNIQPVHETTDHSLLLGSQYAFTPKFSWLKTFLSGGGKGATQAKEWVSQQGKSMKSWREFLNTDKFKVPPSFAVAGRRLVINIETFQSNYFFLLLFLFVLMAFYCILTSPLILLALISFIGISYFIRAKLGNKTFKIGNLEFGTGCQYLLALLLFSPLFFLTGIGSALIWILGMSLFIVSMHALFYASEPVPGADFMMEQV